MNDPDKFVAWSTRYMPLKIRTALNIFAQSKGITAEQAANVLLEEALRERGKKEGARYV